MQEVKDAEPVRQAQEAEKRSRDGESAANRGSPEKEIAKAG